jgi:hypothetical protein
VPRGVHLHRAGLNAAAILGTFEWVTPISGHLRRSIGSLDWDLLDPANSGFACSRLPTAIGHGLLIVLFGSGQLRPRQILHPTDKLRTVAKACPNLGVAGTGFPPGENPPFQRPGYLRVGRRTRPTMRPRTKGQNLGHAPSAAPEGQGRKGPSRASRRALRYSVIPPAGDIGPTQAIPSDLPGATIPSR